MCRPSGGRRHAPRCASLDHAPTMVAPLPSWTHPPAARAFRGRAAWPPPPLPQFSRASSRDAHHGTGRAVAAHLCVARTGRHIVPRRASAPHRGNIFPQTWGLHHVSASCTSAATIPLGRGSSLPAIKAIRNFIRVERNDRARPLDVSDEPPPLPPPLPLHRRSAGYEHSPSPWTSNPGPRGRTGRSRDHGAQPCRQTLAYAPPPCVSPILASHDAPDRRNMCAHTFHHLGWVLIGVDPRPRRSAPRPPAQPPHRVRQRTFRAHGDCRGCSGGHYAALRAG